MKYIQNNIFPNQNNINQEHNINNHIVILFQFFIASIQKNFLTSLFICKIVLGEELFSWRI
jgi:hypothetical protein